MRTKYHGAGWSSPVARQAHNLKVTGSNPVPATNITSKSSHQAKSLVGFCRPISQSKNDARITQAQILALNSAVGPRLFHCNSKQFHIFCATPPPSLKLRLWFGLSAPACPDPDLSTPVFRRLGARTIETSNPWLFGAIRKPTKSLPPFRARAIARDHLSHLFLEIKNNIDYYLRVVCQQIDLKIVIYS